MKTNSLWTIIRLGSTLIMAGAGAAHAAIPADAPYFVDSQHSYVEDVTSEGIGTVNMITCIMSALRPDALVNQGDYIALVDKVKCDPNARSSTSNATSSDGSSQAAQYVVTTVNSTRLSNADPMRAKIWVDEVEQDGQSLIYVNLSASEAPSDANPYGGFRMDFCGNAGGAGCGSQGFLEGSASGLSFYQQESRNSSVNTTALQLTKNGSTSGSGALQKDQDGVSTVLSFAYDAQLFRRSDGTNDQCFSRDATDPDTGLSVWRYGMYDVASGERITRNSGFAIDYTNAGQTYHGYLGFWGLSLPPDAMSALVSGDTVQKVDYSSGGAPTKSDFTVMKSSGKLTRYTKRTRTLHSIDQIRFTVFVNDASNFFAGASSQTQYELYWDEASATFQVDAQVACSSNGCQNTPVSPQATVSAGFFIAVGGVSGWSQSLGGELFIDIAAASQPLSSDVVNVIYRAQDLVYPQDLPATLYCIRDCPTAASMSAYFAGNDSNGSPFDPASANNWNGVPLSGIMTYSGDATVPVLKDGAGMSVVFTDAAALQQHGQYQGGVRSGRLFSSIEDARCSATPALYCDVKVNALDVYYVWETGSNSFNQFAAVKDASGAFVRFDPPLQVAYNVPNSSAYGQFAGKSILLQYSGFGELFGIPGHCVSHQTNAIEACETPGSRYVPEFVIPFDATLGAVSQDGSTYLVKWLEREIRFAPKDPSQCVAANLLLPSSVTVPTSASLKDPSDPASDIYIGPKPVVTSAPRVIQGEVKY